MRSSPPPAPGRSLQAKVYVPIEIICVTKDPRCANFTRADMNVYLN